MDTLLTSSLKEHPLQREFYEPLSGDEWRDFYGDVEQRGITQPIIVSSRDGFTVVDGHQRFYAAKELGLKTVPAVVRAFADELEEARWMVGNNDRRRHETAESRAKRADYFLKKFSMKSNRVVAEIARVGKDTVRRQREKLEASGEIPKHEKREEASGRLQTVEKTTGARAPVKADLSDYTKPRYSIGYNPARHADNPRPEPEGLPEEMSEPTAEPSGVELPVFRPSDAYRRFGVALDTLSRFTAADVRQLMREEPADYQLPLTVRLGALRELLGELFERPEQKTTEVNSRALN